MVGYTLEELKNREIILYGNIKQEKDIQYVFYELQICGSSEKKEEILEAVLQGQFAVLCKEDNSDLIQDFIAHNIEHGVGYCFDNEFIQLLNFPVAQYSKNRKIVVWGTGYWCTQFEKEYSIKNFDFSICAYVDNNSEKIGKTRNGLPIIAGKDINPQEHYVIVCTNYENYIAIKKDLHHLGYGDMDFVYFRTVIDDVAGYFRRTYECYEYYDVVCKNRDRSVRIKDNGDVCTCCMAYNSVYGNMFEHSFEEVWNSRRAYISRLALENKTYVFCDSVRCPFLSNIKKKRLEMEALECRNYKKEDKKYPDSIAPEVDISCNLYCTSCRNKIFIDNNSYIDCYVDMVLDKLINLPTRFIFNTVGELFASKNCLRILYDKKAKQRDQISIYSNGTLMYPSEVDKILQIYKTIEVAVSVDAATQETYGKIRRNGNFTILCNNLNYISKKRKEGRISYFQLNYVLQADNIVEMHQFVKWAKQLGVDRIAINGIEKWSVFTDEQFEEVSLVRDGHIKEEFKKYFTEDLITDSKINFFNIANYIGAEPKVMYMV